MFRLARKLTNPFTRTAVLAFAWTHRHEILRWGRSLWAELTRPGRIEPSRLSTIAQVLWKIAGDESLSRSKKLRSVRLDGDVLVLDTARGWRGTPVLVSRLQDVSGIRRIVDSSGREVGPVIDVA
jgi:hypothetical protein